MKYRLPGGPPPPLHVKGAITSSSTADPATAKNVNGRHNGWTRSDENSQSRTAITPGKKYGTNPKWRPTRKYSTLVVKRCVKSFRTFSASESLVALAGQLRSTVHGSGLEPSSG